MSALKVLRSKLIATMVLTLLSGGTAAVAQNQGAGPSGAASSTIPQAPIGHRQPRADQVPSEKNQTNPNDALAKENAILDQKMKSICRGC
jgi:ABC-type hemin transport system ATPase subunit